MKRNFTLLFTGIRIILSKGFVFDLRRESMMHKVTGKLLRVSFKPKFVLIGLARFFVALILILYTGSVTQSHKGSKLLKTVGSVEVRLAIIFALVIESLKPGIGQKFDIRPIKSKRVLFR